MSTFDEIPKTQQEALRTVVLWLADDRLIHGHRLSEWAGHGPELEEDLALANMALDMIGHASSLYAYVAKLEGREEEDYHAYFRDDIDFTNCAMVELPRGDFAFTMARQFLFSVHAFLLYQALMDVLEDEELAGILKKHFKEIRYHLRHSGEWMRRLGDGTDESRERVQHALDDLWMYTGELFTSNAHIEATVRFEVFTDPATLHAPWMEMVRQVLDDATLTMPDQNQYMFDGARQGRHTEHLGRLLAEMQFLRRSYPDASWT
ncbi:MAG: phenylacetate-CoA oxygenase subunit PaaI [Bacteroidetes bacterium]|jgi:ring-1,2-phenylacetyl-CoA epoxidase subunit PaaC|nr:MAG: phenylacetate-CoA oxygenase subunit PaaI [Bacteroidota bacterium]